VTMQVNVTGTEPANDDLFVEKRASERVRDAIGLEFSIASPPVATGVESDHKAGTNPQARQRVRKHNKYVIEGYADVKSQYPAVAMYIDQLEERIRTLLLQGDRPSEHPTHKVSLSASGLAFSDNQVLEVDTILNVRMTLFPSLARVNCLGRIVSAGDAPEVGQGSQHTYRLTFLDITSEDQVVVNEHVLALKAGLARHIKG